MPVKLTGVTTGILPRLRVALKAIGVALSVVTKICGVCELAEVASLIVFA